MRRLPRMVKVFKSRREQEAWDIRYYVRLTPRERQRIARELRLRYYGDKTPSIRGLRQTR
jgi:hypothetical protein